MSQLLMPLEDLDDGAGELQGYLCQCSCSNVEPEPDGSPVLSVDFNVFFDPRHNPPHLHIQCTTCEQTYCPFSQCVPPPTAEVVTG